MEIQKNVPLPESRVKRSGITQTIRSLAVGDSFTLSYTKEAAKPIYRYGQRTGVKLATRREGDQLRVWRVE